MVNIDTTNIHIYEFKIGGKVANQMMTKKRRPQRAKKKKKNLTNSPSKQPTIRQYLSATRLHSSASSPVVLSYNLIGSSWDGVVVSLSTLILIKVNYGVQRGILLG